MHPFYEDFHPLIRVGMTHAGVFPEHLHAQMEMLYLFEGRAELTVGGRDVVLEPGDLCVCFPGVVHGYLEPENARALMMIFSPEISPDFSALIGRSYPKDPLLKRDALPADVVLCMDQLRREADSGGDERVMRGYLQVILARTVPMLRLNDQPDAAPDIATRILQYLARSFTEPLTLADLSRALGVSQSHLSHTFSRRFHTNFRAYINALRLDRACELLRGTERTVTRIAYECGFESQRTFNRLYLEKYGLTPTEYRKRHLRTDPRTDS